MTGGGVRINYPFSAVVGQDQLQLALILLAVDPGIGGVLIRGQKGTAKTTTVRGIASLVPAESAAGDALSSAPFVELPLGATEDRVVGSLDLDTLVESGRPRFRPGLLSAANGGVLYVDEVNLLADHLVDVLLDTAATGQLTVERDGVSHSAQARFALVGTMNPEEGELRPQLLDRFGLAVDVSGSDDPRQRVDIVRRRRAFDADPKEFASRYAAADQAVTGRIARARAALPGVTVPERELLRIALVCLEIGVEGMRADVVIARTASAHAAIAGRDEVTENDIRVAARLALPHRRRRDPFDPAELDDDELEKAFDEAQRKLDDLDDDPDPDPPEPEPDGDDTPNGSDSSADSGDSHPGSPSPGSGNAPAPTSPAAPSDSEKPLSPDSHNEPDRTDHLEESADSGDSNSGDHDRPAEMVGVRPDSRRAASRSAQFQLAGRGRGAAGRRSAADTMAGRLVSGTDHPATRTLHLLDTARASAVRRSTAPEHSLDLSGRGSGSVISAADVRWGRRLGREGNLVVFLVDTSGSMAARRRLDAVTGSCVSVLRDAYVRRDMVAVVEAHGNKATVAVPPTRSVEVAVRRLANVGTGGRTPLAEGFVTVSQLLARHRLRDPERRAMLVVLTDGRATYGPQAFERARSSARQLAFSGLAASLVVDCEAGRIRLGAARELATDLAAPVVQLDALADDTVSMVLRAA